MSLYHINEGTFDLPDAWVDRTMQIFAADDSESPEWNIVISRDKVGDGETVAAYVERQLAEMPKALPRFRLVSNEETTLDGLPAREIVSTWVGDTGTLRQQQVATVKNGRSLVFTFTVLERLFLRHQNVLTEFLKSFATRRAQ